MYDSTYSYETPYDTYELMQHSEYDVMAEFSAVEYDYDGTTSETADFFLGFGEAEKRRKRNLLLGAAALGVGAAGLGTAYMFRDQIGNAISGAYTGALQNIGENLAKGAGVYNANDRLYSIGNQLAGIAGTQDTLLDTVGKGVAYVASPNVHTKKMLAQQLGAMYYKTPIRIGSPKKGGGNAPQAAFVPPAPMPAAPAPVNPVAAVVNPAPIVAPPPATPAGFMGPNAVGRVPGGALAPFVGGGGGIAVASTSTVPLPNNGGVLLRRIP